jgi:translation initiation factor eIF-2B subunit epsilon
MQYIFPLQNVRREFITGVLSEEELGNKIFVHELERNEYTERVANLRAYDAVSRLGTA